MAVFNLFGKRGDGSYVARPRRLATASYVEIAERRDAVGHDLRARLFLYNEDRFLICSVAGIAEVGGPTVLPLDIDDETLGLSICDHLLAYLHETPPLAPGEKASDWPAFIASRAKSMRQFEAKLWHVDITGGRVGLYIDARPRVPQRPHSRGEMTNVHARGSARLDHEHIGQQLRATLRAARVITEAGIG